MKCFVTMIVDEYGKVDYVKVFINYDKAVTWTKKLIETQYQLGFIYDGDIEECEIEE